MNKKFCVSCETWARWIAVSLLTVTMGLGVVSCGVSYTEEDVKTAVKELLPLSFELNEIYFGEGLPISDNREDVERFYASFSSDVSAVNYHPVAEDCEYQTEADIKAATEKVYSPQYCEYLYELAFTGISAVFNDGTEDQFTTNVAYARYIETDGVLTVRLDLPYEAMDLGRTYDMNAVEILSMKQDHAIVKIPSEMNGETLNIELKLILTNDGFRLDTPTY